MHEALMLGGEAAAKAGFTIEEASQNSPLWSDSDKKKEDTPSADVQSADKGGYQSSSYV